MKKFSVSAAFVCLLGLVGGSATAAPIEGLFSLGSLTSVQVGVNFIDWGPGPNVTFNTGTDSFAPLVGSTGTLKDLTNPPAAVGTPISISNFLTATLRPTWNFTLTNISPGSGTDAGCGDADYLTNCTPTGSPFTLTESGNGPGNDVSVTLRMQGTVMDLVGPVSPWSAIFTTQFTDTDITSLLEQLGANGFIETESAHSSSWRATAQPAPVPEPASMMLLGTGLTLLAGAARRKKRAQ